MSSPVIDVPVTAPAASVVVCTYNRANMLGNCLASLLEQSIPGREFEIVVIDDGSTDGTAEVVEQARNQSPVVIRYVKQVNGGIGNARNRGILEACAPWIAFFDDDQLANETWLVELLSIAESTGADCVGGPCFVRATEPTDITPVGTIGRLLGQNPCMASPLKSMSILNRFRFGTTRISIPGGGNVLIKKTLLEKLKGFRPLRYGEDLELFRRAAEEGVIFAVAHRAIAYHLTPPERLTPAYLYALAKRGGISQASIDWKTGGPMVAYKMSILRIIHLALITVPSLIWHLAVMHKSHVVSGVCSLRFAAGYIEGVTWSRVKGTDAWAEKMHA